MLNREMVGKLLIGGTVVITAGLMIWTLINIVGII